MGEVATVTVTILSVVAALFVAFGAHELGHVLGAKATGMQLRAVRIGRGPVLVRQQVGSVEVTVCPGPGGLVACEARDARHLRRKVVLFAVSGPVVGALVCLALAPWFGPAVAVAFVLGAVVNLLNLVPAETGDPITLGSDGLLITKALRDDVEVRLRFTLPHQARQLVEARAAGLPIGPVVDAYRRTAPADDPTTAALRVLERCLTDVSVGEDEVDEVRELLLACPDVPDLWVPVAHLVNSLVYATLEAGRRPPVSLVDRLATAVGAQPDNMAHADTLGWALAATGAPEAGLRYSDRTLAATNLAAAERARCLAVNAICLAGTGALDAALARRADALTADPHCPLIEHVDRALDAATTLHDDARAAGPQRVTEPPPSTTSPS